MLIQIQFLNPQIAGGLNENDFQLCDNTFRVARPISNALKAPVPTKASQAVSCRHLVLRA